MNQMSSVLVTSPKDINLSENPSIASSLVSEEAERYNI
jgi:hypothetical protein